MSGPTLQYCSHISSQQYEVEARSETKKEVNRLIDDLRKDPLLKNKTFYYQNLNRPHQRRTTFLTFLLYSIFIAYVFWIVHFNDIVLSPALPRDICSIDSAPFARPEIVGVMFALPIVAQFFTMYAKESEIRMEPNVNFQLAGAVISFFIPFWLFFTGGIMVFFFTPGFLCRILIENVNSWIWLHEIYASFYSLIFKSLYPNVTKSGIALFSLISVVYFIYVVAKSVWRKRFVKCIGCILMLTFLSYWNGLVRRDEALMAYLFFHVADEVYHLFTHNLAPLPIPEPLRLED